MSKVAAICLAFVTLRITTDKQRFETAVLKLMSLVSPSGREAGATTAVRYMRAWQTAGLYRRPGRCGISTATPIIQVLAFNAHGDSNWDESLEAIGLRRQESSGHPKHYDLGCTHRKAESPCLPLTQVATALLSHVAQVSAEIQSNKAAFWDGCLGLTELVRRFPMTLRIAPSTREPVRFWAVPRRCRQSASVEVHAQEVPVDCASPTKGACSHLVCP